MKKIIDWFKDSNRWLHFIGGFLVGAGSSSTYCAAYAGIGIAGALEFKDKQHGDNWDWIDFGITVAGVAVGYLSKLAIKSFIS